MLGLVASLLGLAVPAQATATAEVSGLVVNIYGLPIDGATVALHEGSACPAETLDATGPVVKTDAQGRFSVTAQASSNTMVCADALSGEVSFGKTDAGPFQLPPNRQNLLLQIRFTRATKPTPTTNAAIVGTVAVGQTVSKQPPQFAGGITCNAGEWQYKPAGKPTELLGFAPTFVIPPQAQGSELYLYYICQISHPASDDGLAASLTTKSFSFPHSSNKTMVAADPNSQSGSTASNTSKNTKTSGSTTKQAKLKLRLTPRPKIVGKAVVGQRLKVKLGSWDKGVKRTIRWYVGKKAVKGTSKLKLKASYRGKRITVRVTGSKSGYASVTKVSKATKKVKRR
jgi:hypothetical protein